ncbi:hypothetical protein ES705_49167 [subsurface metagenome]
MRHEKRAGSRVPGKRRLRPVHRAVESRVHTIQSSAGRHARTAFGKIRRHRRGPGKNRRRDAEQGKQLRHRFIHAHNRAHQRDHRSQVHIEAGQQKRQLIQSHRRPYSRARLRDYRRRDALERRPGICDSPNSSPGFEVRQGTGNARAVSL